MEIYIFKVTDFNLIYSQNTRVGQVVCDYFVLQAFIPYLSRETDHPESISAFSLNPEILDFMKFQEIPAYYRNHYRHS